ncbi:MAG: glutaminase A [Candidatus Devosia phytovorans]|uniref:Glutaminase n=1 Tax=Candidatus Devosia phytovorans TaxID=3121372 RepID=A0AAJ5VUZ6_9HYPH|nr:glutaminase A [Devosia sp.]WEK04606.1 MAG: glutaminase A [Devosia sp.]
MKEHLHSVVELQAILDETVVEVKDRAEQIYVNAKEAADEHDKPAPRKVDFAKFGLSVFTRDGGLIQSGDASTAFPIQSISKVFALEVALQRHGDKLWRRVGREPSGDAFNSIIDLERFKGVPRNPFINAGALVVVDSLLDAEGEDANGSVMSFVKQQLDDEAATFDTDVLESDRSSGDLNRSLLFMAKHHDNLRHKVNDVMEAYVHQCAISVDCAGLAKAGRFLMHEGPGARSDRGFHASRRARRILSIMMTCGMYDGSGDFAFRVGLPAKSGVGGGILAVVPHTASIAAWSPALDPFGNSWLGVLGLEYLTNRTDWSVFGNIRSKS